MSPGYCGSHNKTAYGILDVFQFFLVSSTRGLVDIFSLFHITECFRILFELVLSKSFTVTRIVAFLSTVVAINMIQVSPGYLLLLFYVAPIVPIFNALRRHELVADLFGLIISISVIIRLII